MSSKRQQQEAAGRWLRKAREKRGLGTAGALARLMGVSDSLISRYETGVSAVSDERAEQIAVVLGLDIITVRRNLGLWVPPESRQNTRAAADVMDNMQTMLDEIKANLDAKLGQRGQTKRQLAYEAFREEIEESTDRKQPT